MSDADFPSGPWTGFYQEGGNNHPMDLDLTFTDGHVSGAGGDEVGDFSIRGSFDPVSKDVWWTKRYATHDVHYRGYREVKGIWGLWSIGSTGSGFHIWPLGQGHAASESVTAEADVDEVVTEPLGERLLAPANDLD